MNQLVNEARKPLEAEWSSSDSALADQQGWNLFGADAEKTILHLERDDEAGIFDSDEAAAMHVQRLANAGDPVAVKAIRLLVAASSSSVTEFGLRLPDDVASGGTTQQLARGSESRAPQVPVTPDAQWSPATGTMTDAQYVARRGSGCPSCGSVSVRSAASPVVEPGSAAQKVECSQCGATWTDTYALTGYSDLEGGIDLEAVESVVEDVKSRAKQYGFSIDSETQAREVVNESCDLVEPQLGEAERKIAVVKLMS